ncbi:MAG: glycerophosphodiester phosphodiesterase [Actinomycetota bacterium]|nr:glycerophosphodiester phosphodiesterase [Actinomycetota bacterium]
MIVAHRGASAGEAEHTLLAYQRALDSGADGLECDVRLTRDGHLICVHDRRIDRTSNGRGVVSELDLARLAELDFGSWHAGVGDAWPDSADQLMSDEPYLAGVAPDRDAATGRVLTLDALLALCTDVQREITLLVETKHPTRYAGLVEKELVRTLRRFGLAGQAPPGAARREPALARDSPVQVMVMSFAAVALRRVRLLAPDLETVFLLERPPPLRRGREWPGGTGVVGPGLELVRQDPDFVARAHADAHPVFVWTVDDPQDVGYVLELGVDAVITNDPVTALRVRAARPGGAG